MADEPTALERLIRGILPENPVYRQIIGMCPVLAVTANLKAALTMSGAVIFVLLTSNVVTSLIRGLLKPHLRIIVFLLTISTFVTLTDRFLAAYMYSMSKALGPYIPLIIVNCIIICRCEVCASKQNVITAGADAIGQSLGYALGLVSVAAVREILGSGMLLGFQVLPQAWPGWLIMALPPGAFFTLGLLLGLVNLITARSKKA